jgi:hypothetical protein
MARYKYRKSGNILTLYPLSGVPLIGGIALLCYVGYLAYWAYPYYKEGMDVLPLLGDKIILVSAFAVMLIGSFRRIVLDPEQKMITLYAAGIPWRRIPFDDVAFVQEVTQTSYFGGSVGLRLKLKKDPYGKGVLLSLPYKTTSKAYATIKQEVLPEVLSMLQQESEQPVQTATMPTADAGSLQFYSTNGFEYTIYMRSNLSRVLNALLAAVFIFAGCTFLMAPSTSPSDYAYMAFIWFIGIVWFTRVFDKTVFDLSTRMVTVHQVFGLRKRSFPCDNFINFNILRQTHNGIYTGTTLQLQMRNAKGTVTTTGLRRFQKLGKLELCMEETRYLLTQ